MKELFRAGVEAPGAVDPVEADMQVKERQVAEAKTMLAQAGLTREKFPELYLAIEQALDGLEEDAYRHKSGEVEN